MNILVFLVVGLFAGWIASSLVKGHGLGTLRDVIVGIIGALVGGFIFNIFGITAYGFWGSLGMSIIGAMVFLFIISVLNGSHSSTKQLGKS